MCFVAQQLKMSIDTPATVLRSLQQRGFIAVSGKGLRIVDLGALKKLLEPV